MTWAEIDAHLSRHYGSHERPDVVYGMWMGGELPDDAAGLAVLVADVWTDRNEQMAGNLSPDEWLELLEDCHTPVVDDSGVAPEWPFTAYRAGHPDGMSWTTDRSVAERFSDRNGVIHRCTVTERSDLLAVLGDRDEHEVVPHPQRSWRTNRERTVSHACHGGVDEG